MPLSLDDVEQLKENLLPAFTEKCRDVVREEIESLGAEARLAHFTAMRAERIARRALNRKNTNTVIAAVSGLIGGVGAYLGVRK